MVGEEGEEVHVDPMLTIQAAQQLAYRAQMAAEKAAAEAANILKIVNHNRVKLEAVKRRNENTNQSTNSTGNNSTKQKVTHYNSLYE